MLSVHLKRFYRFILKETEDTTSHVNSACTAICEPKWLAVDKNGKCYAFSVKPILEGNFWMNQDKNKVFVMTMPQGTDYDYSQSLHEIGRRIA
jgi:hypothetical protein